MKFVVLFSLFYIFISLYSIYKATTVFPSEQIIAPKMQNSTFNWNEIDWKNGEIFTQPGNFDIGTTEIHGYIHEDIANVYKSRISMILPRYFEIENAFLGPDGRIYKDNRPYPLENPFISGEEPAFNETPPLSSSDSKLRIFDRAIAMPRYYVSETLMYSFFLPMLSSVPKDVLQNRRLLTNRYLPDLDVVCERIGIGKNAPVYTQFGWTYAKNLLFFELPEYDVMTYDFLHQFGKEVLPNIEDKDSMKGKIAILSDGYDNNNTRKKVIDAIDYFSNNLVVIPPINGILARMELFSKFDVLISYDSDNLNFVSYMKPGSTLILVQSSDVLLKYVMLANEAGVNVHVVSASVSSIPNEVTRIIKSLYML